ncbi:Pls/PosA family non-ribosomal peptide synthetase [Rhodococcus sp. SGAir0479]|uniref:Pls/PosA family non-ribosomal peptide synthetase n=1 Tax=Rhodococcus sp. SGAir0479 TaxID=2567884 RepID=UPI0020C7C78F|nr:Pls/PosA family non-ribosomal peptide synthetase [Rhodococcus sp. SGAir0479]
MAVSEVDDAAARRERSRPRRLNHVFEDACDRTPFAWALECGETEFTYAELDASANRLAHLLIDHGIGVGARIALLLERSPATYIALLASLKSGATFVPVDPGAPPDRIDYIISDADVDLVLTSSSFANALSALGRPRLELDTLSDSCRRYPSSRPVLDVPADLDPVCYVIYTSGSTGKPKGVAVAQSSICNFLDVVPEIYDVQPTDRVYQGMTISFDFSIEEIWPTWARGATLVAGPTGSGRLGADLADFLEERRVTKLYCVPTLLATIPRDLPQLRTILVGGEACPGELVERWSRPGRRILNTYGPTEATVTATWGELLPGRLVTIGRPLPTYSVVILDEHRVPVPDGEIGEICIGGPGVARGYVGRPEQTAERFIVHPSGGDGKLYRTGDLGRIVEDGEIEYLGRADSEIKIRGHRVDLGEIESVLLEDPEVATGVVSLVDVAGTGELAAYVSLRTGSHRPARAGVDGESVLVDRLLDALHRRLPHYMIPAYLDIVDELPTMPSGKVDRTRLPAPGRRRSLHHGGPVVAPATDRESRVRAVCADVLGVDATTLSVESDFFTELGGHSLAAAKLVSTLRESEIREIGLRDVYAHPTVRALAARLDTVDGARRASPPRAEALGHDDVPVRRAGTVQASALLFLLLVVTLPVSVVYSIHGGRPSFVVLRDLLVATVPTYLGVRWVLPVLLVRPLSRGIRPGRYPLWGTTYLRLWAVDRLLALSPSPVLAGSPIMAPFLRALGARVGRDTEICTGTIPLPALVRIGDRVSVGYNTDLRAWRVEAGWVIVGEVVIEDGAFVGSDSVLEPGAHIEVGAMLADQSVVDADRTLPARSRYAGSPSRPVAALSPAVEAMAAAPPPRSWSARLYALSVLGLASLEAAAIAALFPSLILVWYVLLTYGMVWAFIATLASGPLYVLSVCAVVAAGKRVLLPDPPTGTHSARSTLGIRKWLADKLFLMSLTYTGSLYATLYTGPWLRLLGARVGRGAEVSTAAHIDPDLLTIGDGSFVADMASVGGSSFCNGWFTLDHTVVGERAFIGNAAHVPAGARTGDRSLVGVLTVPHADGVPADSSWLGSPAIHLPVRQDSGTYDESQTFAPPRQVLAHRWFIEFFRATLPATLIGVSLFFYLLTLSLTARSQGLAVTVLVAPLFALVTALGVVLFAAALKRNIVGVYRPRVEPLWARFVRRAEFATGIYEAAAVPVLLDQLRGTPFLPLALRGFGADIGKRVWMDTTYLTEFDLVHIGDDAAVGANASLQTHLFEDRVMKMSTVTVASGATVGTRAIVLYDATVGRDATLGTLSLLMKGETLPDETRWSGIPAEALR